MISSITYVNIKLNNRASPLKPRFIFWLEPKNEAKKLKLLHPTFGPLLQKEREQRKKVFARFTRKMSRL